MQTKRKLALFLIAALLLTMVCPNASAQAAARKNVITVLGIKSLPEDNAITVGDYFNFNPDIIATKNGGRTTGVVYWEVNTQTNTAGVLSSRWGYVYPVYAGSFQIRAVAFASAADMNAWKAARSANGLVEDPEAGEKYVTAYSDWVTIQVVAPQEGYAVARTQYQLNLALKNKSVTDIHIVTNKARTFTVKSANYTTKTLTVTAPNSDVINSGRFAQINVEKIKSSTFYEKGWGNKFYITAPDASLHVEETAMVSNLEFAPTNADAAIRIVGNGGRINHVAIASAGEVRISGTTSASIPVTVKETAAGTKISTEISLTLNVNASVTLSAAEEAAETIVNLLKAVEAVLTGDAEKIAVKVDAAAEGAVIKSDTTLEIASDASVSVELSEGAEGTTVQAADGVEINVSNETAAEVVVTDAKGNETVVNTGDTDAAVTTTPEAGDNTGSDSTSSSTGSASTGSGTSSSTGSGSSSTPTTPDESTETPTPLPNDHVMEWGDEGLEAGMRNATGISEGDIMLSDVIELQVLELSGYGISNISALSELVSLESLNLRANSIQDISALENLTNLTIVDLETNQISDISALGNLTNLTSLGLGNNQISDISVLEKLTKLTSLGLVNNQFTDINVLKNLTNLKHLGLYGNSIADISVLENLTNLTTLTMSGSQITDISVLENLTDLRAITISDSQITDISVLKNLTNLITFQLSNNHSQITDISVLENLTNLWILSLSGCQITDISALGGLTNLVYLYLSNNQITDVSALSGLTGLETLDLRGNPIEDYSSVEFVPNLSRDTETSEGTAKPEATISAGDFSYTTTVTGASISINGSTAVLTVAGGSNVSVALTASVDTGAETVANYQWYVVTDGTEIPIDGAASNIYTASADNSAEEEPITVTYKVVVTIASEDTNETDDSGGTESD